VIIDSIRAPERDRRLEQIDTRHGHTFDWASENPATNLTNWLQNGGGLFWVSGKPGSGKSTFMKYIFNDERTAELLHRWKSGSQLMALSFFFHHRGTNLQKSFEGLLRSLTSQILERKSSLVALLYPILDRLYLERIQMDGLSDLRSDLHELFRVCGLGTGQGWKA
jgi:ATPase subunit of ABC transporter with duplicated ATPase domains